MNYMQNLMDLELPEKFGEITIIYFTQLVKPHIKGNICEIGGGNNSVYK